MTAWLSELSIPGVDAARHRRWRWLGGPVSSFVLALTVGLVVLPLLRGAPMAQLWDLICGSETTTTGIAMAAESRRPQSVQKTPASARTAIEPGLLFDGRVTATAVVRWPGRTLNTTPLSPVFAAWRD